MKCKCDTIIISGIKSCLGGICNKNYCCINGCINDKYGNNVMCQHYYSKWNASPLFNFEKWVSQYEV